MLGNKGIVGTLAASLALIIGSLLRWLHDIPGLDSDGSFSGVGIGGWGYGTIVLLLGLLMLAGVMKNPFGIPQKTWAGALGLGSLLLLLAYYLDYIWVDYAGSAISQPDADVGLWIAFGGASLATLQMILTFFYEKRPIFSSDPVFSDTTKTALSGILVIAIVNAFVQPYGGVRANNDNAFQLLLGEGGDRTSTLLEEEFAGTGPITLGLLFALLLATYISLNPRWQLPKGIFVVLAGPLFFLQLPFIFRNLTLGSGSSPLSLGHSAEAGNWVILFCAAIVLVLILRSGRADQPLRRQMGA